VSNESGIKSRGKRNFADTNAEGATSPLFSSSSSCDHHLGVCAEGLGRVVFFPQRPLCNEGVPLTSRALKRFEASRTHTPFPHPRRVLTSFLGCTFSYRSRLPPANERKRSTQKYIKTRLALPLVLRHEFSPYDHGENLKHQTLPPLVIPRKDSPSSPRFRAHPFSF